MLYKKSEKGQAIIMIVFAIIGLIALTGLAVDGGRLYADRRNAQGAADSAVFAAALAKARDQYAPLADLRVAADASAAGNGYSNDGLTNVVEVSSPPATGKYSCGSITDTHTDTSNTNTDGTVFGHDNDQDGIDDQHDDDDDNDGIKDSEDKDKDGDGIKNDDDNDDNNDGIKDENDKDNNGVDDNYKNGNGDSHDNDHDGIDDSHDDDDDNDGIKDSEDDDIDGDGRKNENDSHPDDADNTPTPGVTGAVIDSNLHLCDPNYIQVTITSYVPASFASIIGVSTMSSQVTAVSHSDPAVFQPLFDGNAVVALKDSGDSVYINGNANWEVKGGGVFANNDFQGKCSGASEVSNQHDNDHDGLSDGEDDDDDNDGIDDQHDNDRDGDGIKNDNDNDDNNDGIKDANDHNDNDHDGIDNEHDNDDDNDGIDDQHDDDRDGDGVDNEHDDDNDNDGNKDSDSKFKLDAGEAVSAHGVAKCVPAGTLMNEGVAQYTSKDVAAMMPAAPKCDGTDGSFAVPNSPSSFSFSNGVYCVSNFDAFGSKDIVLDNATLYVTDSSFSVKFAGGGTSGHGFAGTGSTSGPFKGMYIVVAVVTPGHQSIEWRGNGSSGITGTILAPSVTIDYRGNSNDKEDHSQLIAWEVQTLGTANIKINYSAAENGQVFGMSKIQLEQ